jgi:MFS family permease
MRQAMLGGITVVVSSNVLIAYLPAYGAASGLAVEVVGLLLALRAAASMASRLLIGSMRARVNRRTLLVACLIGPALALFLVSVLSEVAILFVAMFVVGFGLGLGQPLTLSWIAGQAPPELRGTAVSLRLAGNRVGQFVVPASLGLVGGIAGVSGVFWSLGLLLVFSALLVGTARFAEEHGEPLA